MRDELIEAMALELHRIGLSVKDDLRPCEWCRGEARVIAPAVVKFVAEFMARCHHTSATYCLKQWREEMMA